MKKITIWWLFSSLKSIKQQNKTKCLPMFRLEYFEHCESLTDKFSFKNHNIWSHSVLQYIHQMLLNCDTNHQLFAHTYAYI